MLVKVVQLTSLYFVRGPWWRMVGPLRRFLGVRHCHHVNCLWVCLELNGRTSIARTCLAPGGAAGSDLTFRPNPRVRGGILSSLLSLASLWLYLWPYLWPCLQQACPRPNRCSFSYRVTPHSVTKSGLDASDAPSRHLSHMVERGPRLFKFFGRAKALFSTKLTSRLKGLIVLGAYFAIGCKAYKSTEGWEYMDSIYFMIVTSTTVGYGDFSPSSQLGRLFTCFYSLIGMVVVFGTLSPFIEPVLNFMKVTAVRCIPCLRLRVNNSLKISLEEARAQVSYTRRYAQAMVPTLVILSFGVGIGITMARLEGEAGTTTMIDAAYFAIITMATIGYGDITPVSHLDRLTIMIAMPFATAALARMLGDFARIATNRIAAGRSNPRASHCL